MADFVREVEERRAEELERAALEAAGKGPTFRELAHTWLEYVEFVRNAKPSTLRDYRSMLAEPNAPYRRGSGRAARSRSSSRRTVSPSSRATGGREHGDHGSRAAAAADRRGVDGARSAAARSSAPTRSRATAVDGRRGRGREDARARRATPRRPRSGVGGHAAGAAPRSCSPKAADLLMERAPEIAAIDDRGGRRHVRLGHVQLRPRARMLREAAAQTYAVIGEVIPSDVPGRAGDGRPPARRRRRRHGALERARDPLHARGRDAARVRQHRRAQGARSTARARTPRSCARSPTRACPPARSTSSPTRPTDAPDVVDELIAHPAVRRVNFTGSTRVGRIVAEKCAEHLKRCLLELGGKAPQVVLADADLDEAAAAAQASARS